MCYSAEADLVAGLVIGGVGIDAIRHVEDRRLLPLASVPLVLAGHQLLEAVAWWSLEGRASAAAGDMAVTAYLIIAFVIVPTWFPMRCGGRSRTLGADHECCRSRSWGW